MIKMDNLENLYNSMKTENQTRVVFPFEYNERGFSCLFLVDILPYRLHVSSLGNRSFIIEFELNEQFEIKENMNNEDYINLVRYLDLRYNPENRFRPKFFLERLNLGIPIHTRNPNYSEVLRNSRNIEENERIYFCGWRNNNINERVSDENLYKTKIAFGDKYFEICRKNNISFRWTNVKNEERINEINNILD